MDLAAIGDLNIDIITEPIARMPKKDQQLVIDKLGVYQGGSTANCAASASMLGLKTSFIGRVGDDANGRWLKDVMKGCGVKCHLTLDKKESTGVTFAMTFKDGTRSFISYRGTNARLCEKDIKARFLPARHVHRAGYFHTELLMGKPTAEIFKIAREKGAQTSLDIGWDYFGWTKKRREGIFEVLKETDIFFVNGDELRMLTGVQDLKKAATTLLQHGPSIIAIHQGKKGSTIITKDKVVHTPAFKVKATNPTGAGDVYNAAFIYSQLKEWRVKKSALFANAAAALHIRREKPSYPTLNDIKRFINKYG